MESCLRLPPHRGHELDLELTIRIIMLIAPPGVFPAGRRQTGHSEGRRPRFRGVAWVRCFKCGEFQLPS